MTSIPMMMLLPVIISFLIVTSLSLILGNFVRKFIEKSIITIRET
jgi:hypothetical protein